MWRRRDGAEQSGHKGKKTALTLIHFEAGFARGGAACTEQFGLALI